MEVIFSERAFISLLAEVKERITTETGGLFLGYYDNDTWYIIETCDPGMNAVFQMAYFEYDQAYTGHLLNKLARIYNIRPKLIGLWHRHPGSFDVFSATDDITNTKYSVMNPEGAISMLVNLDPDFRLSVYHVSYPHVYTKISYKIGDNYIPEKFRKLKSTDSYFSNLNNHSELELSILHMILNKVIPHMETVKEPVLLRTASESDNTIIDFLSDALLDDLIYITDTFEINLQLCKTIGYFQNCAFPALELSENKSDKILFTISTEQELLLYYRKKFYKYENEMIKKLMMPKKDIQSENITEKNSVMQKSLIDTIKKTLNIHTKGEQKNA